MHKFDIASNIYIDPVCWMKVASGRKDVKVIYLMRTYYFCSEDCRKAFKENPDRYLALKSPWYKGVWKLYWKRLKQSY